MYITKYKLQNYQAYILRWTNKNDSNIQFKTVLKIIAYFIFQVNKFFDR